MKFLIDTDKKEVTVYENIPLNSLIKEINSLVSVDWNNYKLITQSSNKLFISDLMDTNKNDKLIKPFIPDTHIAPYRYKDNYPNKYNITCSCGKSTCGICNNLALNM